MNYRKRINNLRKKCLSRTDLFLVTSPRSVYYFTGFFGSVSILLITKKEALLLVDSRYYLAAKDSVKSCKVIELPLKKELFSYLPILFKELEIKPKRVGIEENGFRLNNYFTLTKKMPKTRFIPSSSIVDDLRAVKDEDEIVLLKKSAQITYKIFKKIKKKIDVDTPNSGVSTEIEIARFIEDTAKKLGADGLAFDPIVLAGKRSAQPHGQPGNTKIKNGEFILFDFGVKYKGYCSDLSRTLIIGKPTKKQETMLKAVEEAKKEATDLIKPGVQIKKLIEKANSILEKYKLKRYFTHALGHGVGLQIHESPSLSVRTTLGLSERGSGDTILQENMTVTIEPGVYIPSIGGVRIEDTILVTKTGHEILTK